MALRSMVRPERTVEVEGAGSVLVRGAGAAVAARAMDAVREAAGEDGPEGEAVIRALGGLAVQCIYDPETGEREFEDDQVDDFLALPLSTVEMLSEVAMELSGIGDPEDAKKG